MKKTLFPFIVIILLNCCNTKPQVTAKEEKLPPRDTSFTAVDLPDSVVTYLDRLPQAKINFDEVLLPNKKIMSQYLKELGRRTDTLKRVGPVFRFDTPKEQLSQLIAKFLLKATDLVDDSKHQFAAGAGVDEPAQNGLGYNYGSRVITSRAKMYAATCTLKVYALDCSGLLYQVYQQSGCTGMDVSASSQSQTATLNSAIAGVVTGVAAKDKGKLTSASIQSGDIVYWSKIAGAAASHIGMALKKTDGSIVVFQSNGTSSGCADNLIQGRGPRTFAVNDVYWFSANCDWKVLRYE
jgi:hypothetical protein